MGDNIVYYPPCHLKEILMILILTKKDLNYNGQDKKISDIEIYDFDFKNIQLISTIGIIEISDIVIFLS
jgi:hypothetical protein